MSSEHRIFRSPTVVKICYRIEVMGDDVSWLCAAIVDPELRFFRTFRAVFATLIRKLRRREMFSVMTCRVGGASSCLLFPSQSQVLKCNTSRVQRPR